MSDNFGLLVAVFLSLAVVLIWKAYFEHKYLPHVSTEQSSSESVSDKRRESILVNRRGLKEVLEEGSRVTFDNSKLKGSINLLGARIDDLVLKNYKIRLNDHEKSSEEENKVRFFAPEETEFQYFAQFGWASASGHLVLPDKGSLWVIDSHDYKSNSVDMHWDNGKGLRFRLSVVLDDNYLFKINQSVVNHTDEEIVLAPKIGLRRVYDVSAQNYLILHQGPIGTTSGSLFEDDYKDVVGKGKSYKISNKDWFGFSDKYWAAIVIGQGISVGKVNADHEHIGADDVFEIGIEKSEVVVSPGAEVGVTNYLFAGAKELDLIDVYLKTLDIPAFDRVVDFGRLYFITKPVFLLLQYFNGLIGNFGLAILLLTVVVKLMVLPLSIKSYMSMLKMKQFQPEIARLREVYRHDSVKFQQKNLALFKKKGINPASGCLPALMQVPIFFSLYKVLFITLEMRHAPFFLWVKDLSARDTSSIFTLFGILDFNIPATIDIGVLSLILGFTMVLQQKINSAGAAVTDKAQANVLKFMPYLFTFLFASFPAGLIIYWIWNNILSILQQLVITKFLYRR